MNYGNFNAQSIIIIGELRDIPQNHFYYNRNDELENAN